MIVSLIFGLLRLPWWSPAALTVVWGIIEQAIFEPQRAAWRSEVGLAPASGGALTGFVIALALNYLAFAIGLGIRELYQRSRKS